MTYLKTGILAAGLMLAASPASALCKIGTIVFDLDLETHFDISAAPGDFCAGKFDWRGWKVEKITVPDQPRNGLVNIKDNTWKYQVFPNFKGKDDFALRIFATDPKGRKSNGKVVGHVTVR